MAKETESWLVGHSGVPPVGGRGAPPGLVADGIAGGGIDADGLGAPVGGAPAARGLRPPPGDADGVVGAEEGEVLAGVVPEAEGEPPLEQAATIGSSPASRTAPR